MWNADYISYKGNTNFNRAYQGSELVWEKIQTWTDEPFWVENINDYNITFYVRENCIIRDKIDITTKGDVLFSFDKENWEGVNSIHYQGQVTIPPHTKMWLINDTDVDLESTNRGNKHINLFSMFISGRDYNINNYAKFNIGGNFHSILYNWKEQVRNLKSDNACNGLFMRMKVVDASELILPSLILTNNCYEVMFDGCEELLYPPVILPAKQLADFCYLEMFNYCEKLIKTPILPATDLPECCYGYMFAYCPSLQEIQKFPNNLNLIGDYCCSYMFIDNYSLETAPDLNITSISGEFCCQCMFYNCEKLKHAKISVKNIGKYAFSNMFSNCENLEDVEFVGVESVEEYGCRKMFSNSGLKKTPKLSPQILNEGAYESMFKNCEYLVDASEMTLLQDRNIRIPSGCYYEMFCDCPSLEKAPKILSYHANYNSLWNMFADCISLTEIVCLLERNDEATIESTQDWVKYIPEGGKLYKHPNAEWEFGTSGIPSGWEVIDYTE